MLYVAISTASAFAAAAVCSRTYSRTMTSFRRVQTQFIAADPGMTNGSARSGTGASQWGIWRVDPGPRGVRLHQYQQLEAAGGTAPAGWKFDRQDWWLEEHGLIMEKPEFPMPSGRYMLAWLNGAKAGQNAVLTVDGDNWELDSDATLYDVTHLPCRSARYTPTSASSSPANARAADFPVRPGSEMPKVEGCNKSDYAVLFVEGLEK
eukprot:TRINITY_DN8009_c0_g6_i1.p1 TRINITY_DN8009_c0_g6~~TRINITY_DN8009_c0_g6_i1.p1  ORF type:complete len:207 (-),score=45.18 TRINITY_DN8009_c0_g6_i1:60-680(-)